MIGIKIYSNIFENFDPAPVWNVINVRRDDFMSRRLSLWSLSPVSVGHPEDNLLFYWIINFIVTLNKLGLN